MTIAENNLGRLEKIELRNVWTSEAGDFTPWLAEDENLRLLSATIGMDLELEAQEKNVGPFRADILCKDTDSDSWVLIENQLEKTDHRHLGQLLTYAAGLNAVTVIWVADRFTDEHRAALDWLNEITDESFNFFGLEVELWKIGDSAVAPKFNLASKPNTWSKSFVRRGGSGAGDGESSENQKFKNSFWDGFRSYVGEKKLAARVGKTRPKGINFPTGKSYITIETRLFMKWKKIHVGIRLAGDYGPARFDFLLERREEIDGQLGEAAVWTTEKSGNTRRIVLERQINPLKDEDWPELYAWLGDRLQRFQKVFTPLLPQLDASEMVEELEVEDD